MRSTHIIELFRDRYISNILEEKNTDMFEVHTVCQASLHVRSSTSSQLSHEWSYFTTYVAYKETKHQKSFVQFWMFHSQYVVEPECKPLFNQRLYFFHCTSFVLQTVPYTWRARRAQRNSPMTPDLQVAVLISKITDIL